jgi:hypothetical protein
VKKADIKEGLPVLLRCAAFASTATPNIKKGIIVSNVEQHDNLLKVQVLFDGESQPRWAPISRLELR